MAIDIGCNRPRPTPPTPRPEMGCICRQVERIDQIQKEALLEESCLGCNAPNLGDNVRSRRIFNTRPFSLYLPNGDRLAIVVDDDTPLINNLQPEFDLDNFNIEINNLENTNNNNVRGSSTNRVTNIAASTNTRPTTRVNSNNNNNTPNRANVFRVESVQGCCAVLRALLPRRGSGRSRFVATCACCTVDLNDFVCIQCFDDTFINLGRCFDD
ncbi:MAG: hypothetical protein K0Q49_1793 [Haloplasmataceae bacterium]|nr:hypothetical protein [Haloplasmataceae bacterium]